MTLGCEGRGERRGWGGGGRRGKAGAFARACKSPGVEPGRGKCERSGFGGEREVGVQVGGGWGRGGLGREIFPGVIVIVPPGAFVWNSEHLEALLVLGLQPAGRPRGIVWPGKAKALGP